MIVLIGNAPSSGSTYLADLLDSLPTALCGPELHLFSPRCHFDDFECLRQNGRCRSATPSCYAAYGTRLSWPTLSDYGLGPERLKEMLQESDDFPDFAGRFFAAYARHRDKDAHLFFDKTPENIHTAASFLATFNEGYVVHMVRDPLAVFRSLRRRGYPFAVAASTWLIDVAAGFALKDHPRMITLSYEDLTADPDQVIGDMLDGWGLARPDRLISELAKENAYRQATPHLPSWQFSADGSQQKQADSMEDRQALAFMRAASINPAYATHFSLPVVSFTAMADHFGYSWGEDEGVIAPDIDGPSRAHWLKKWTKDAIGGRCGLGALGPYLSPVVLKQAGA